MSELAKINGYDIRDKKLADEGTVTTASSSDYVLLEDTNGNYQKIAKNSFTEAVRNTLGDLLRTNDKGTSITGVPALSGSGTSESPYDFGSISTANLASVLGAKIGMRGDEWEVVRGNSLLIYIATSSLFLVSGTINAISLLLLNDTGTSPIWTPLNNLGIQVTINNGNITFDCSQTAHYITHIKLLAYILP